MEQASRGVITVAAALVTDGDRRVLLGRKAGTTAFMQPGGKIEPGETPLAALGRELIEEIGLRIDALAPRPVGVFVAPAANEPRTLVEAHVFRLDSAHSPVIGSEIAEAVWVARAEAALLPLAPLTRDHLLPLLDDA